VSSQLSVTYQEWMGEVQTALQSINMDIEAWQSLWTFDFEAEYKAESKPNDAALKPKLLVVSAE